MFDHIGYNRHVLESLPPKPNVDINDSCAADQSHDLFKRMYRKTSMRQKSAVQETFHLCNTQQYTWSPERPDGGRK